MAKTKIEEQPLILKLSGGDLTKAVKDCKFDTADDRVYRFKERKIDHAVAIVPVTFGKYFCNAEVRGRLDKRDLKPLGLIELLLLRKQTGKLADQASDGEKSRRLFFWDDWVAAIGDELEDVTKGEKGDPTQMPPSTQTLSPYITVIGSSVHLVLHNVELPWQGRTVFLATPKS